MTDEISHRRAMSEEGLSRSLKTVRTGSADMEPPARAQVRDVLEPLIRQRLVRRETGAVGTQYELVHDFTVRAIVQSWDRLDRERTIELGRLQKLAEAKERRYQTLSAAEDRMLRFLALGPAIAIVLTVAVFGGAILIFRQLQFGEGLSRWISEYTRFYSFLSPMRWIAIAASLSTFAVASVQRHTLGMWFSGLMSILTLSLLSQLLPSPTDMRDYGFGGVPSEDLTVSLMAAFVVLVVLLYPRLLVSVSRATNGSERAQRVLLVTWTDMLNLIALVTICVITAALSILLAMLFMGAALGEMQVITAGALGVIAGIAAFAVTQIHFMTKRAWHGLLPASEYQVRLSNEAPLDDAHRVRRSIFYSVWLALNVFALTPLVLIGPLCIYFLPARVAPYDQLAGTILVPGSKEPDHKEPKGLASSRASAPSPTDAPDRAQA
jgi:hypothetical protein